MTYRSIACRGEWYGHSEYQSPKGSKIHTINEKEISLCGQQVLTY